MAGAEGQSGRRGLRPRAEAGCPPQAPRVPGCPASPRGGAADTHSLSRGAGKKAQMWSRRGKRSLQAELTNVLEIKVGCTRLQSAFHPEWRVSPLSPRTLAPWSPSPCPGPSGRPTLCKSNPFPPKHLWTPGGAPPRPAAARAGFLRPRPGPWLSLDFMEGARGDNELPGRILISPRWRWGGRSPAQPGSSELVYQRGAAGRSGGGAARPAPR